MEKQGKKVCGVLVGWDWFFWVGAGLFSGAFGLLFFSGVVYTLDFVAGVILPDYFAGVFVTPEIRMFCFHKCVLKRLCLDVH